MTKDYTKDTPMLIKRCLTHAVKIYPYQLQGVLNRYHRYTVPDEVLKEVDSNFLKSYVEGLYLSSCESAGEWSRGLGILEELGFKKTELRVGHRVFQGLEWSQTQ